MSQKPAPKFKVGDRVTVGDRGEVREVWGVRYSTQYGWSYWISSEAFPAEGSTSLQSELKPYPAKFEIGKTYASLESAERFAVDNVFTDRHGREVAVGYKAGGQFWAYQDQARFWRPVF